MIISSDETRVRPPIAILQSENLTSVYDQADEGIASIDDLCEMTFWSAAVQRNSMAAPIGAEDYDLWSRSLSYTTCLALPYEDLTDSHLSWLGEKLFQRSRYIRTLSLPADLFRTERLGVSISDCGWDALNRSIDRWAVLPDDWDGEDGSAPPEVAVSAAREFIKRIRGGPIPAPKGYVAGDGEIGFRWTDGRLLASAAFPADGHIVIFCSAVGSFPTVRIDAPFDLEMDLSPLLLSLMLFDV
ncbi:hypothetical protein ASE22_23640 [Sphingomonas sp. Root720]|nr:hypothetical protein ASE22_23640 [Sphingomonas sp. Root720]